MSVTVHLILPLFGLLFSQIAHGSLSYFIPTLPSPIAFLLFYFYLLLKSTAYTIISIPVVNHFTLQAVSLKARTCFLLSLLYPQFLEK